MKSIHLFTSVFVVAAAAAPSFAQVLFSDQFAPSTAGTDLTTYNSNYVVSTSGSPPAGSPMHVIAPSGSGAFLSTSETGGNPAQTRTTLTNDPDFTNTAALGAFDGMGGGTFYAGALFDFDSLQAARDDNRIAVGTSIVGQHSIQFGIESINDGADFRAYAQQGGASVSSAPLSAADANADGDILLMVQWKNQTGSFDANNDLLLGINPLMESDLTLSTGRTNNYNGTVTNNAALELMQLLVETDNFPGPPGNPMIQGTIESVAFGLTFDDAIPTLFQTQAEVPEPNSLVLWGLLSSGLAVAFGFRQCRREGKRLNRGGRYPRKIF